MSEDHGSVKVHISGSDIALGGAKPHKERVHTKYTTIQIAKANANGAFPVLPYDEKRVCAVIIAHNPADQTDAATSAGWLGPSQAGVKNNDPNSSMYVHSAGQGPVTIYGCEAIFCASDNSSSTDLWLSVADSSEAEPA